MSASNEDMQRMRDTLRDETGSVELDVEAPVVSASIQVASEGAERRAAHIAAGERVAFLYTNEHSKKLEGSGHRQWLLQVGVTRDQALELLKLGGKWIGPEHQRPGP